MRTLPSLALCAGISLFAACEKKPQVVEKPTPSLANVETARLGVAIDAYVASPTDSQAASVEKAFAELDGEIAELDQRVTKTSGADREEAQTKSTQLHTYRDKEMARYTEAKARAKTQATGAKVETAVDKIEDVAKEAGNAVKEAADKTKEKLP
jgi:Skp family chaperone for outer membrane proteins